jgi:hypothetical protein
MSSSGLRAWFRRAEPILGVFDELFDDRRFFELIGAMTLLMVILHLENMRGFREVIILVCAAGILDRRLMHRPAYWGALTGLLVVHHVLMWHVTDNHKYLQTYWCVALGLSRFPNADRMMVGLNARWLIGLCFLFAAFWKLFSGEFVDGAFFQFTLLTDPRFRGFADVMAGVPADVTAANLAALEQLRLPHSAQSLVQLEGSPRIAPLALFLTYWTIAVEGSVAMLFLLPERFRLSAIRDVSLLLFMFSTYPVATVVGFGRLLALMGLAQTRNRLGVERAIYFVCFLLMPLYRFPFVRALRLLIG